MAKQLNINLGFNADTSQAKQQIMELRNSLNELTTNSIASNKLPLTKSIMEAQQAAASLKVALDGAINTNTGKLDLSKFSTSLNKAGLDLATLKTQLTALGPTGVSTFQSLATSIMRAEVPLARTNTMLAQMWTTLKNTARWQLSSTMLHGFMRTISSAFSYAKNLDQSLNNIRIVTNKSTEEMARFAEQANQAARALNTTTTAYTNASLIYYQQGLSAEEVKARTDITIKMANVSRQSAEVVSDQMTAVWNNFYDGSKSLEYYADVMTALGAKTASSADEIAGGLEKFAAIGDTIGLSYEYAASALATITAETRQSEEVVGTALKTIFARIQGLKLGETLEDGTELNKYSEALKTVGIDIFDANKELKDMDTILNEMGSKWKTLSRDQQTALAQTVAGVRQYNQLMSLMNNWDVMQENLHTSYNATGALNEQNETFAEGWEAARNRVKAAAEDIYDSLIDEDAMKGLLNGLEDILNMIGGLIDSLNGLPGVLSAVGLIMTKVFGPQMAAGLERIAYNFKSLVGINVKNAIKMQNEAHKLASDINYTAGTDAGAASAKAMGDQLQLQNTLRLNAKNMTEEERNRFQALIEINKAYGEQAVLAAKARDAAIDKANATSGDIRAKVMRADTGQSNVEKAVDYTNARAEMKRIVKEGADAQQALEQVNAKLSSGGKISGYNKELEKVVNTFNNLGRTDVSAKIEKAMVSFQKTGNLDAFQKKIQAIINSNELLDDSVIAASDAFRQLLAECGLTVNEVDKLANEEMDLALKTNTASNSMKGLEQNTEQLRLKMEGYKKAMTQWSQSIVNAFSGIASLSMGINSLIGMFETLNNQDLSFGEKLLQSITSLSMAVPSLMYGLKGLHEMWTLIRKVLNADTLAKGLNATATWLQIKANDKLQKEQLETAETTKASRKEIDKDTSSKIINSKVTKTTGKDGKEYYFRGGKRISATEGKKALDGKAPVSSSTGGLKGGFANFGKSAGNFLKAYKGTFAKVGLVAAGLTIAVTSISAAIKIFNQASDAAKKAAEEAALANQAYQSAQEAYNTFKNDINEYKNGQEGLKGLTKGTIEYEEALMKANDAARALISSNDLILNKDYEINDITGEITIKEGVLYNLQKERLNNLKSIQTFAQRKELDAKKAELEAEKVQFMRSKMDVKSGSISSEDGAYMLGGIGSGAGIGMAIGSVVPVIGSAIGTVAGGIIGGVVGGITSLVSNNAEKEEQQAIKELAQLYSVNGESLFANFDEAVSKVAHGNEDLEKALRDNEDEVKKLIRSEEELNETAKKLVKQEANDANPTLSDDQVSAFASDSAQLALNQYVDREMRNKTKEQIDKEYLEGVYGPGADTKYEIKDDKIYEKDASGALTDTGKTVDFNSREEFVAQTVRNKAYSDPTLLKGINKDIEEARTYFKEELGITTDVTNSKAFQQYLESGTIDYGLLGLDSKLNVTMTEGEKDVYGEKFEAEFDEKYFASDDFKREVEHRAGINYNDFKKKDDKEWSKLTQEEKDNYINSLHGGTFVNEIADLLKGEYVAYGEDNGYGRAFETAQKSALTKNKLANIDFNDPDTYFEGQVGYDSYKDKANDDADAKATKKIQREQLMNYYKGLDIKQRENFQELDLSKLNVSDKKSMDAALDRVDLEKQAGEVKMSASAFDLYTKKLQKNNDALKDNNSLAREVTKHHIQQEEKLKTLVNKYGELKDKLDPATTSTQEYTEACDEMATALNAVFGEGVFDAEFVADPANMKLIENAMNGSVESVERLQDLAGEKKLINLGIDVDSGAGQTINDWIGSQEFNDLEVGLNIDNQSVIDSFNQLLEDGKITAGQLTDILSEAGYAPEYEYETLTLDEAKKQNYSGTQTIEYFDQETGEVVTATLDQAQEQGFDGSMQVRIPKLKSAKKMTDAGDIASSLKKNNDNNNKSGGGGKSSKPKKVKPTKSKKKIDEVERYHEINQELEDLQNTLDEIADLKDEAWGTDKLAQMDKEKKKLEEITASHKKYQAEIAKNLHDDRWEAETKYGAIIVPSSGRITNYEELQEQWMNEWNAESQRLDALEQEYEIKIAAASDGKKEDLEEEKEKNVTEVREKLDEEYEEKRKAIEQYEETLNLSEEAQRQLDDYLRQIRELNYEQLEYKLEIRVELNENDIADIEHQLERLGDNNVYASAERIALIEKNAASYRNIADAQIESMREAERLYQEFLNTDGKSGISKEDYMARLQEGKEALQDAEMSIRDGIQQIGEELSNTFDLVDEKLDQQFTKFDQMIELMEHYKNVVSLTEGEASYNEFNKILRASQEVLRDRIAADESEVTMWTARREQLEAEMKGMDKNSPEYLAAEEALNNIMEKEADAKSQLMADIEQLGEYAREIFENSIEQAMKDFEDEMFGRPLNSIIESIEMMNSRQEELLTTTNKIYETNKLIRNVEKDIEATTNNRAKQAFAEFQNKVKQKQEQNELTKFELDLLTAEYEMTKAQIALEEAQNAKDTVRLTRDTEGNYGYVYTANEDKVADAEQALDDATNNYYNTALEGAQKYQDQIYQHIQEWEEKVKEVYLDQTLSEEEKNKKIKEINDTYNTLITQDKNLYYMVVGAMQESAYNTQVDYDLKGIESAENWFTECDGFLSDLEDAQDEYDRNTKEVSEHTEENFGKMSTAIRNTKRESEYLKDQIVDELVPELDTTLKDSIDNATEAWWKYIEALQRVIELTDEAMQKNSDEKYQGAINDFSQEIYDKISSGEYDINDPEIQALIERRWKKMGGEDKYDYTAMMNATDDPIWDSVYNALREYKIANTDWMIKIQEAIKSGKKLSDIQWMIDIRDEKQKKLGKTPDSLEQAKKYAETIGATLATGGYTGSWGPEGKLAVLHEKELVLNAEDTKNFLSATGILREISQMLDRDALIASLGAINLRAMTLSSPADQVLQQEVTIHADFPNVTDHNEIEIAIDNLINAASQHAYRT